MPPASTARGTAYLTALTIEIEKKLQRALASASQRRNLLQELFADVALEVDDRAKEIILGEEDAITVSGESRGSPLCFYNVLADHFARMPENGKSILDLIVRLWSQSFASNIFSLLFNKWLFEFQLDNPVVLLRFSSALIQGATNVFWIDIQTNVRRFQSFFQYLLEEVSLDSERLKKIPPQAQRDLFLLLSRVMFFYDSDDKLESFFKQFPDFPNAFLLGSAADIFVIELADQLQKLKVEPVLLHYLSRIKVLQGLELRLATSTRLKTCLYSFTSPGAPMYPTRAVRHAAWDALDFLFPVGVLFYTFQKNIPSLSSLLGRCIILDLPKEHSFIVIAYRPRKGRAASGGNLGKSRESRILYDGRMVGRYPRHLISLFFRLLYPWYWPSSCWNFVRSCIQAVMYSLLRLIFASWEKLRPKES